jgi:hypothetical protein
MEESLQNTNLNQTSQTSNEVTIPEARYISFHSTCEALQDNKEYTSRLNLSITETTISTSSISIDNVLQNSQSTIPHTNLIVNYSTLDTYNDKEVNLKPESLAIPTMFDFLVPVFDSVAQVSNSNLKLVEDASKF